MHIGIVRQYDIGSDVSSKDEEIVAILGDIMENMLSEDDSIDIWLKRKELSIRAEVVVNYKGNEIRREELRQEEADAIDAAIRNIRRRIVWLESKDRITPIVREKKLKLTPMTKEQAATQMRLVDHQFYMFKDISTGKTCVIYARNTTGYGILSAEE